MFYSEARKRMWPSSRKRSKHAIRGHRGPIFDKMEQLATWPIRISVKVKIDRVRYEPNELGGPMTRWTLVEIGFNAHPAECAISSSICNSCHTMRRVLRVWRLLLLLLSLTASTAKTPPAAVGNDRPASPQTSRVFTSPLVLL